MRNRRLVGILFFSAALHAGVFALLLHFNKPAETLAVSPPQPVELDILESAPSPSPSPIGRKAENTGQPTPESKGQATSKSKRTAPGKPSAPGAGSSLATAGQSSASQLPGSDIPRRSPGPLDLFPKGDFLVPGQSPTDSGSGRTLHNQPASAAEEEFAKAETEERVKRRVEDILSGEMANQRVQNGGVDSYFSEMKAALKKQVSHPPRFDLRGFGTLALGTATSYAAQAARYGRTGNPSAAPDPRPLGDGIQDAEPHRFGDGLLAVIELRQASDGKVVTALLLKSSGNKKFDSYVLQSAPSAIEMLAAPPAAGAGIHSSGTRSVWAFEGGIVYLKDLKKYDLRKDLPYLLGAVPLSILGGMPFDETTGSVGVYDYRDPQFTIDVRLMRVY